MISRLTRPCAADRQARRGSLSVLSVFAIVACGVCVALVVNSSYLSVVRSEAQQCSEAAALAGCRSLLCDQMLCRNQQPFETEGRIVQCRHTAIEVASLYRAGTRLPILTENDITVSHPGTSGDSGSQAMSQQPGVPGFVEVTLNNSATPDASGRLFLSGITGVARGQVVARATAVMENRIAGFTARSGNAVPLAPFAVPDDSRRIQSGCWSVDIELNKGADNFAWSESSQRVERGGDRLPETTLTLAFGSSTPAPGRLLPVYVASTGAASQPLVTQLQSGLSAQHLQSLPNSMLTFPASGRAATDDASSASQVAAAFETMIGSVRIFPAADTAQNSSVTAENNEADSGSAAATPATASGVPLTRAVAARIMNVRRGSSNDVQITLQPAVISTATAVVGNTASATPPNPYIWKIVLAK
ncbi:MAG: hypothetical protein R3C19_03925 [Planctomycetaceae bacterium]